MNDPWDDLTRINPGYGMPRYSRVEVSDLLVAMLGLSVAFMILLYRGGTELHSEFAMNMLFIFSLSLALVSTSFIFHELAHKVVAQRYGAWAEFRLNPRGLLLAMVMSLFGFLFAAPGAVYIRGMIDQRRNAIISIAGPLVNIVIGGTALICALFSSGTIYSIFLLFAMLNGFLALFNLLPIPPLDGSKIYGWNMPIYIMMMVLAGVILAGGWGFLPI